MSAEAQLVLCFLTAVAGASILLGLHALDHRWSVFRSFAAAVTISAILVLLLRAAA